MMVNNDLVGGLNLPLWKIMEWKSVGMMTFPTEWKVIRAMFHTSNQVCSLIWFYYIMIMVGFAGLTKIKLLQPTVSQKQTCITLHNCQSPPKNNWLVVPTPLKNMKVSWDDHISNTWKDKKNVPNRQPVYIYKITYIYKIIYIYI